MRYLVILLVHVVTTIVRFVRPGGLRAVVAETVIAKHQLLILNRSRQRARLQTTFGGFGEKPRS